MKLVFEATTNTRASMQKLASSLSSANLVKIPKPFRNSSYWQIAHLTVTAPLLTYGSAGLPLPVPQELVKAYKKGTVPPESEDKAAFPQISHLLISSIDAIQADYEEGKFSDYKPYLTSRGILLATIEDALCYSMGHDHYHHSVLKCYHTLL